MKYQLVLASVVIFAAVYISYAQTTAPAPLLRSKVPFGALAVWDFEGVAPLLDKINSLPGYLMGGATIVNGALVVNGNSQYFYANTSLINLGDKTLESWVRINNLDSCCPGVAGIQTPSGSVFDSIVYNEKGGRRWIAGSDFHLRTVNPTSPIVESEANARFVHLAVTYTNNRVQIYREGLKIEDYNMPNAPFVVNGLAWFTTGLRHTGGGLNFLVGSVDEIRFYNRPLSSEEILANWCGKASVPNAKTLSFEMHQDTNASPFTLTNLAGTGGITMFAVSGDSSVASVSLSPAIGPVGTVRTLSYVANAAGTTLVNIYHSDSVRTCVAQQLLVKVFPPLTYTNSAICTNSGGRLLNNRCAMLHRASQGITWTQANDVCRNNGGHLASIRSISENAFLRSLVPNNAPFWIGLQDRYTTGMYTWTDGSTSTYRMWGVNEPNEGKDENCVIASADGTWRDEACDYPAEYYICQLLL